MLSGAERRSAYRVNCHIPVRLATSMGRTIVAETTDLSRTGARVRIPLAELGLEHGAELRTIAQAVQSEVGDLAVADIHHERLGPLLRRHLHVVRIAQHDPEGDWGRDRLRAQQPDHQRRGGLHRREPPRRRPPCARRARRGRHDRRLGPASAGVLALPCTAVLAARGGWSGPIVIASTVRAEREGFVVELLDLPFATPQLDVGSLLEAFVTSYGNRVVLEVRRDAVALWRGTTRVYGVEIMHSRTGLRLYLVPPDPFSEEDSERLGSRNRRRSTARAAGRSSSSRPRGRPRPCPCPSCGP